MNLFSDLNDLGSLGDTQDVMWYYNSLDCLEKGVLMFQCGVEERVILSLNF